jgi:hypothetical protein
MRAVRLDLLHEESTGPRALRTDLGDGSRALLSGVRTTHSRTPGIKGREYSNLAQAGVRG